MLKSFIKSQRSVAVVLMVLLSLGVLFINPLSPVFSELPHPHPPELEKQVWAIYVGSWGNPMVDHEYTHWKYRQSKFFGDMAEPPGKMFIPLYPALGIYSSHDQSTIRHHLTQMKSAGITGVIMQFYHDSFSDDSLSRVFVAAKEVGMYVSVQIEPYDGRTNETVLGDIQSILYRFASSPSFLRIQGRPALFVYEPHAIEGIRGSIVHLRSRNPFLLASIVERAHISAALEDGFDGVFTFFASDGFTYASNITNWNSMKKDCDDRGLAFIPSVGPGYNDGMVNWWNSPNRDRDGGKYYDRMWEAAFGTNASAILINSFNNWVEGTMIEPAVDREEKPFTDSNWKAGGDPEFYLRKTKDWASRFNSK